MLFMSPKLRLVNPQNLMQYAPIPPRPLQDPNPHLLLPFNLIILVHLLFSWSFNLIFLNSEFTKYLKLGSRFQCTFPYSSQVYSSFALFLYIPFCPLCYLFVRIQSYISSSWDNTVTGSAYRIHSSIQMHFFSGSNFSELINLNIQNI